jgi:hypothetical protein
MARKHEAQALALSVLARRASIASSEHSALDCDIRAELVELGWFERAAREWRRIVRASEGAGR